MRKVTTNQLANIDQALKDFVETSVSDSFGLTVSEVANNAKTFGRFSAWLGGDISRIEEVLQAVSNEGVSPAFFASYEKTEGYNSDWGWLNHTSPQGDPLQDAISVARWIVTQSTNMTDKPAWIDFANYKDFVPESVKQEGNAHFESTPAGSIGRVVIAGTAAATWEVYYPNGLLKEYNGVQDYGKPLTGMKDTILAWGGGVVGGRPAFPTTTGLPITSPYGWRDHPDGSGWKFHGAIDIGGGGVNHPIYATQTGLVTHNFWSDTGGWHVHIQHSADPYFSRYLHLNTQSPIAVGSIVNKGQEIGTMGTTGISTGIHLDFAISINGTYGTEEDTIDPEVYLQMSFGGQPDPPDRLPYFVTNRHSTNMRRQGVRGRR